MFYDYHTHSDFSDDSPTPLKDMLDAAVKIGLTGIAVTDHFDPGYPDSDYPFELDFENYTRMLESYIEEYSKQLKIAKGIERTSKKGKGYSLAVFRVEIRRRMWLKLPKT